MRLERDRNFNGTQRDVVRDCRSFQVTAMVADGSFVSFRRARSACSRMRSVRGSLCRGDAAPAHSQAQCRIFHQYLVEIFTPQVVVAGAGTHFDGAFENLDDGHVERSAAEIENQELRIPGALGRCRQSSFIP